jgi:pimeloyl-ACP methyl ester carboxylesterase
MFGRGVYLSGSSNLNLPQARMMRHNKASFVFTFYLLCAALIANLSGAHLAAQPSPKVDAAQNPVPRFETSACAIAIPETEKENARCGYLVVLENRSRKDSRLIRLPVIILKSNSAHPAPDPVLRTLGGPGASSLKIVRGRRSSPWLNNRDEIIFEQRGTAYAQPKLDCPEIDAAKLEAARLNLDQKTAIQREVRAAQLCRDRLLKNGIDLAGYDSAQSAADIEDLRRVLGYQKWNLYGVSYSSRLMLEVMRDYPEGVRSVALESVLAPSVNYDETGVDGAMRALNVLFNNCAADAACASAYPHLAKVFYELVSRTNKRPISLSVKGATAETLTLRLTGHDITTWVLDYLLSADPEDIAAAPSRIYQVAGGDNSPLKAYAESKVGPGGFYMWGMRYSVWCREEMPFENRRTIAAQSRRYAQLRGYEIQASLPAICDVWKVPPAAPVLNEPVKSDIPALILAGEYDAYTPPAWGRLAAQTLSHSYFYEVPGVGHGPGFSSKCARDMVALFFDGPATAPKDECLKEPRQRFTTNK